MGTATLRNPISIMSSSIVHQQELTLVAVCRKIVDSVSSDKPMKGDLVEIPQYTEKVLREIAATRITKDDRVRTVAQGIVLGNILGIEDLNHRAPVRDGLSDEEYIEGLWSSACSVLASAITSACDPAFLTRARNEVTQFVTAIHQQQIHVGNIESHPDPFVKLAFDEGYKEANGNRHDMDAFQLKLALHEDQDASGDEGTDDNRIPPVATPLTPKLRSNAPAQGIDKRAAMAELAGRANTNSNAGFTNGYMLWIKTRTMVHRRISTQKQEMVGALNSITSAGFYKRFQWDDWVLCTSSILNSLAALGWTGSEKLIIEGLSVSIGDEIINIQMRENLSRDFAGINTFLELVKWIDCERERMRLPEIPEPPHPVVSSRKQNTETHGYNYAAVANDNQVTAHNTSLARNVTRKKFACFNCGNPDHKVNECPAPQSHCGKCGGKVLEYLLD